MKLYPDLMIVVIIMKIIKGVIMIEIKKYVLLEDTKQFNAGDIVFELYSKFQEIEVMDKEEYPTKTELVHWSKLERIK